MSESMVGVIGGTGLCEVLSSELSSGEQVNIPTPFGDCSGPVVVGTVGTRKTVFINRHGDGHIYNPSMVPYAANIWAMKKLGVRTVIATGAVGSLRDQIKPGELVIVDQFIDKPYSRQSSFFDELGAVHCEFSHPTCERLRGSIIVQAKKLDGIKTHDAGTYICMEGPAFSTRAESLMHRAWGGDLIGMTALPEAKLAREAQMCYALVAIVSDFDCWKEHDPNADKQTLLEEIIGNLDRAASNAAKLIEAVLISDEKLVNNECPCRKSLESAVWTRRDVIDRNIRDKFDILFK